jgi:phosphoserine phosphatase
VDLDGTLIAGDTLRVALGQIAIHRPWLLPVVGLTLLRGRSAMKSFVAGHVLPDPASLRWRQGVLAFLAEEREKGRTIILATASDRRVADAVATHLGLFDDVIATDRGANLKAQRKLAAIRKRIHHKDFDYVGDSAADLCLFRAARFAYLVAPSPRLLARARREAHVEGVLGAD